jgi:hypothetical protein
MLDRKGQCSRLHTHFEYSAWLHLREPVGLHPGSQLFHPVGQAASAGSGI